MFEFYYLVRCGENLTEMMKIESEKAVFLEKEGLPKRIELMTEQIRKYNLDESSKHMFDELLEGETSEFLDVILSFFEIFQDNINLNANILQLSKCLLTSKMLVLLYFQLKTGDNSFFKKIGVIKMTRIILNAFLDIKNTIDHELNKIFIFYKKKVEQLFKEHETLCNFILQEKVTYHENLGKRTKADAAKFINSAIKKSIDIKNQYDFLYKCMCDEYTKFTLALQVEKIKINQKYNTLHQQFELEEQNKPNDEKLKKKNKETLYRVFIEEIIYSNFFESDVIALCFLMVDKYKKKIEKTHGLIMFASRIINNLIDFFYEG